MYRRRIASFIAIPLMAVACSTPGSSSVPSSGGAPSVEPFASIGPGASQAGGGAALATVEITVVNGPRAGDYTDEPAEGGCGRNFNSPGSFAVSSGPFIDLTDELEGYLVMFLDAASAGSGTDNFQLLVYFYGDDETLNVIPVAIGGTLGTGTATLDDRGDTASITVEATTEDGIEMSATIECHSITDY
jgi:hypothetical protein